MLTDAIALATALAGPDYRWEHAQAPTQVDSKHRRGLTLLLTQAQGGLCAACGDALEGPVNLCHIVASRISGRGLMPGNIYVGHVGCNDDDSKVFGDIVPVSSMVRPDLISLAFPTRKACLAAVVEEEAVRAERRERRMAL